MAQQQLANGGKKPQNQQGKKKPSGDKKKAAGSNENGRVGQRPYARGRAYDKSHYDD